MASEDVQIAVVGLAAELPGGNGTLVNLNLDSFFEFLLNKGESYERIPEDRFNIKGIKGRGLGQLITETGSFLKDIASFDPIEFGVTTKDSNAMPVGTRKLLETTFLALLDSGVNYRGQNVGCYMAGIAFDPIAISGHDDSELVGSFGGLVSTISNRVSYHLDLRGPSVPTDTACSSSLVGTHLAVQALKAGDCDIAVVGGAQLNHRFAEWIFYTQGGILSPDGKCKPWDAGANGFGRAEGVVSIVLKRLDAAIRDHDKVYATILGTGINNSGSLAPVNAPVAPAQQDAMERAFAMAKRQPQEVDFLELHATGTASGDPTEANWVGEKFKRDDELLIGSVKGNVGHMEITAFLGSLTKVIGMFKTGLVAPNVNLKNPNPAIHWEKYKFRVPLEPEPLKARNPSGRPLVAMTSSGITGANGHAVIEGPPKIPKATNNFWISGASIPGLFIAGGLSPRSTTAISENMQELVANYDPHTLSRIFGRRSRSMTWRSFSVENGGKLTRFSEASLIPKTTPPLVFVFSGQGPQHFHMGRGLFQTNQVFRKSILELDDIHRKAAGYSLIERYGLFTEEVKEDTLGEVWPIAVTLPSLAILQIALFDTFVAAGVKPDAVIGHSAGETTVLYASGSGSKQLAVELAVARGKAMSLLEDKLGTMAAVSCSPEEAEQIIAEVKQELGPGSLEVGCYNTPGSITLSGLATHIDLAVAKASDAGIFARRLRTRIPVHSTMMKICEEEYRKLSADVFAKHKTIPPTVNAYSTLNGEFWTTPYTSEYYWDSTVGPVRFTQAMEKLTAAHPGATYLEIGPHPVLASYLSTLAGKDSAVTCPLRRPKNKDASIEVTGFADSLGKLVVTGHSVDFDTVYGGLGDDREPPLTFPFSKKVIPWANPSLVMTKQFQHRNGPMNYPQLAMNVKTHPGLADHLIKDEPIMPAAGYMEMALEFGARQLWNVQFVSILGLSSETAIPINVELEGRKWSVKSAAPGDQYKVWPLKYDRSHATGYLSMEAENLDSSPVNVSEIRSRLSPTDMKDFYKDLSGFAQYGKKYQRVTSCLRGVNSQGQDEFLLSVRANEADLQPDIDEYRIHPSILDAAIHITVHPIITGYKKDSRYYLPSKVGWLATHEALDQRPFPKSVLAHVTLAGSNTTSLTYDVTIADEDGTRLVSIKGFNVALHGNFVKRVSKRFEVQNKETEIVVPRTSDGASATTDSTTLVFEYVRGNEIDLQKDIAPLDTLKHHTLWFHTTAGKNGDAGVGFTRSIRREFPAWTVHTAVFDPSWSAEERKAAIQHLASRDDCEVELSVDADGKVTVPRIEEAAAPTSKVAFNASAPWVQERSKIIQTSEPDVAPNHVLVNISAATVPQGSIWSFVGHLQGTSKRVVGVTTGPLTNTVVAHKGSVVEIAEGESKVPNAVAHAIAGLAVGSFISNSERLSNTTVAVEDSDAELTSQITQLFSKLGVSVKTVSSTPSVSELQDLSAVKPNIVIASTKSSVDAQNLADVLSAGGRVITWQDSEFGIPHIISADPWALGDAIRSVVAKVSVAGSYKTPVEASSIEIPSEVEYRARLFSAEKSYVLVGGIGSLGVEIAHWMYKNGARHITLTSRSGRDSLMVKGSFLSKRQLAHLEALPDLTLQLVAADALSQKDMSNVVNGLTRTLGGFVLLSVVFMDRSFLAQTKDSFEASFGPKTGAFEVLEKVAALDKIDFLVSFSSVSAMFGNAGQTNYASANTALSGLSKKYRNAFSLIAPAILDSNIVLHDDANGGRVNHLSNWGMAASELCEYIGDGIRKLRDGPVAEYIPDFDWNLVHANMGASTMYAHLVTDDGSGSGESSDNNSPASLKVIVCKTLNIAPEDLSHDVPFANYGLDSLSAASLSYALAPVLKISQIQLLADTTLRHLEERLAAQSGGAAAGESAEKSAEKEAADLKAAKVREMRDAVERHTQNWPNVGSAGSLPKPARKTVLITGTTGSLGAHALEQLLNADKVEKVYAFVRKRADQSSADRQKEAFVTRGLDASVLDSTKLVYISGNLTAPQLGLSTEEYDELINNVSDIAHFAWTVNFAVPLSGYENDIKGLRAMLDLAIGRGNRRPANFVYAGSAGVVRNYEDLPSPYIMPEELIQDPGLAVGNGYHESKWVSEWIMATAAEKTPVRPSAVRVTQLTGGRNGAWKTTEWFPSLVGASIALGCLPECHDPCPWLDIDTTAAALIDMLDSDKTLLHLEHSRPRPLHDILVPLSKELNIPLVTYKVWLDRLVEAYGKVARGEIKATPLLESGIRLLDLFQSMMTITPLDPEGTYDPRLHMAMTFSIDESKTLQDPKLRQLDETDVQRWLTYWRSIGYIPQ